MKKTLLLLISAVLLLSACGGGKKSLVIGVSQCSNDIWRSKLNEELKLAARANGVEVRFVSADDNSERQMEQIWAFMKEGVDLLVVSPNQTTTITHAVEDAFDAGIPVILFDRKIDSDKYTAFIGADNVEIGRIWEILWPMSWMGREVLWKSRDWRARRRPMTGTKVLLRHCPNIREYSFWQRPMATGWKKMAMR